MQACELTYVEFLYLIVLSQNAVQTSSLEHLEIISCLLSQTVPSSEMLLNIYHLLTSRDKYVLPMRSFVRVVPVIIPVATTLPASIAIKGINGSERLWFIVLLHLLNWVSFGTSLLIVALIRTKKS